MRDDQRHQRSPYEPDRPHDKNTLNTDNADASQRGFGRIKNHLQTVVNFTLHL